MPLTSSLVERTFDTYRARAKYFQNVEPYPDLRFELAFDSSRLSLEHSEAACLLLHEGLEGSAISIMRTQFETLVRGMWFAYVATEQWIQKFATPLTERTARRADAAPMLKEMLDALQTSSAAPQPIIDQICEYRDVTWKALNVYTLGVGLNC